MPNIDLYKAYDSIGESIHDLFDRTEEGFLVPLYQREYTWEQDNINQFFEDLVQGIQELSDEGGDNTATFLGTVIFTSLDDKTEAVREGEKKAEPTAVQIVIDGQQRISTIALLGIQIREHLKSLCENLPGETPYEILQNHCNDLNKKLCKLYTIALGRGANPPNKPKIISAQKDRWTYAGEDKSSYHSPIARYIAIYISEKDSQKALNVLDSTKGKRVRDNIELICDWLNDVSDAHILGTRLHGQFPTGDKIVSDRMQKHVLGFDASGIEEIIRECETCKNNKNYFATASYHVFLLAYYLLYRCGVNCLKPMNQDWGFDMFQSLNATGTPLTAMETFLPQVMQAEDRAGNKWEETQSSKYMDEIDELFKATKSNERKNQRTNELLKAFALCSEGKPLGNKFSAQRRWITDIYEKDLSTIEEKRIFVNKLAKIARFFHVAWYMEDKRNQSNCIKGLEKHQEGELASFLTQYLKDANSKLSAPILARFYSQALEDEKYVDEFIEAVKACAAFFTLWRSTKSTSGLDDILRQFLRGAKRPVNVEGGNWKGHPGPVLSESLKQYFLKILKYYQIDEKNRWITSSEPFLLYTEAKKISRFILFLAGHDRVGDKKKPGLTTCGNKDVCPLLGLDQWSTYKSLEHIAPQHPLENHGWDPDIYEQNKVHQIGNLLPLPIKLNELIDNKNWVAKFLHYSYVGMRETKEIDNLENEARRKGVTLSKRATQKLKDMRYMSLVESVLNVGIEGSWNASIIDQRTQQIKETAWEKLIYWLKNRS